MSVVFKNTTTKVDIICKVHGIFSQTPKLHLNGAGCPKCGRARTIKGVSKTTDYFKEKALLVHGDLYDYSKSVYIGAQKMITIICKDHGEFEQCPNAHTNGAGCPKCTGTCKLTTETFIEHAQKIHGDLYDYSKVDYVGAHKRVTIICKTHGEFRQNHVSHGSGSGCPKCAHTNVPDTEEYIKLFKEVHGNTYDYMKTVYVHSKKKLIITCKKNKHGDFLQLPNNHLRGQGCPICRRSHGETKIANFLNDNNIRFIEQYKFSGCRRKRTLPFDFYIPDHQCCIEFDGKQHKKSYKFFGGDDRFKVQQENDKIKSKFCRENNIQLIRITGLSINWDDILKMILSV